MRTPVSDVLDLGSPHHKMVQGRVALGLVPVDMYVCMNTHMYTHIQAGVYDIDMVQGRVALYNIYRYVCMYIHMYTHI